MFDKSILCFDIERIFYDAIEALRFSYKKVNPFCAPFTTTNMGSAMLAMDLGWMVPNYSTSTACATSSFCTLNSANHIIKANADLMLCDGSDSVMIPLGLGGFVACRALSQRNNDPTKASRPWDSNRDGFVMGEGAGVLHLEELEHAKDHIVCKVEGAKSVGTYPVVPSSSMVSQTRAGVILCIEKALEQSGVSREDVNYINAHATSAPAGDVKEYNALIHCFGQNPELRVNSTKSMIGHLLGASGAVEAVAALQANRTGWIHPNINLENPDEGVSQLLIFSSNPGPNGSLFPHFKTAFSDRQGRLQICTRVVQPDGEFPRMLIEKLKHPSFASPILHIRTLSLICLSPFAL
ncbi:hypothetical protein ACFX1X_026992 [Malus domestica]